MTSLLVLDSNVYISAVLFGGKPRLIIHAALAGRIRLAISASILEEIEGVLSGKKFKFSEAVAREIVGKISSLAEIFEAIEKISRIEDDPADDRILECALAASAAAIVSGDSRLLALGSFRGIPILTPADSLERYKLKS
jgi:putative PIN family toxin of toxin-antitoxin system